jgi:hypothetical protein
VQDCSIDLCLSAGHNKADVEGDAATLTRQPQVNSEFADCSLGCMSIFRVRPDPSLASFTFEMRA